MAWFVDLLQFIVRLDFFRGCFWMPSMQWFVCCLPWFLHCLHDLRCCHVSFDWSLCCLHFCNVNVNLRVIQWALVVSLLSSINPSAPILFHQSLGGNDHEMQIWGKPSSIKKSVSSCPINRSTPLTKWRKSFGTQSLPHFSWNELNAFNQFLGSSFVRLIRISALGYIIFFDCSTSAVHLIPALFSSNWNVWLPNIPMSQSTSHCGWPLSLSLFDMFVCAVAWLFFGLYLVCPFFCVRSQWSLLFFVFVTDERDVTVDSGFLRF